MLHRNTNLPGRSAVSGLGGGHPWMVSAYMAGASVITLASDYLAAETYQGNIAEVSPGATLSVNEASKAS